MTESVARTHTHSSNRLKPREGAEKKTVYKAVFDNPFRIQWFCICATSFSCFLIAFPTGHLSVSIHKLQH